MTKTDWTFDPDGYAPVAERVRLFYKVHPTGRIETELVSRTEREVVFKALVFRAAEDTRPAATGWAAEREGDGDINLVACLENTETSAVGRALANLGFTASRQRPSAEEMAKASRARAKLSLENAPPSRQTKVVAERPREAATVYRSPRPGPLPIKRMIVADLLAHIDRAAAFGVRAARVARWKALVTSDTCSLADLARCERRLRIWISRRVELSAF